VSSARCLQEGPPWGPGPLTYVMGECHGNKKRKRELAELQVSIFQQQELAGKLERAGDKQRARAERNRLYPLLHRLDLLKASRLEA
jgi:hypothetical protein